jgi:3-deoxy-D-manno-octulosonate 8-phosphate phosphatase (KDO 8-P phosphatase)
MKTEKTPQIKDKKPIKVIIFDVDGVLTDGKIYLDAQGGESKVFHTQDGVGIKMLQEHGVVIAIISGLKSPVVSRRMESLNIRHVHQGIANKKPIFEELLNTLSVQAEEVAYVGDDLPDLEVMRLVGLPITVANAVPEIKKIAHYTATRRGGNGGVREICDWLMQHHLTAPENE